MNRTPHGDDRGLLYAQWRVFWLIVASLAMFLAIGLPVTGYTIISKFRSILFGQVMYDNDTMSQYFEAFLRESKRNFSSEEEWLKYVRSYVEMLTVPDRSYLCMVDSDANLQAYPHFDRPLPAQNMTFIPYIEQEDRFDETAAVKVPELLTSPNQEKVSGQFTASGKRQLVDFRRIVIDGKPWLIGVHQYDSVVNTRMKELYPYIITIGVILFAFIVFPFGVFTRFLIRNHERERNNYVDSIQKHSDEIEHLQTSKNRLYARLSHDLRAPLNSIISSCNLVSEGVYGPATDKQHHAMTLVERNVNVLLKLIEGILELSRLESGRVQLRPEPFALNDLVKELVENLRPLAEHKGLELRMNNVSAIPTMITDRDKLYLVLQNLAGNAIKFTEQGYIEIDAHLQNGAEVAISVRDTGRGIAPEDQEMVFQEFTRANGEGISEAGVGLGLAITRELSQLLGGRIRLLSTPGEGSTFTLSIPLQLPAD